MRIGSLCSGYGGLDLAVEAVFHAHTAWFSEFEPAPSRLLAKHWPGVPNHGDMTKINWSAVEPVGIIAGGTPCQDLSAAGKRKGMTEGTRSNLWVQMREAVATIRPSLVIWENVRGAFSTYATSEVESEPGLLGTYGLDRPALRALGRVLGDLSDLGYDTEWVGVRASDAGAPHGRFRVFVVAYTQSGARSVGYGDDVRVRRGTFGRRPSAGASSAAHADCNGSGTWDSFAGSIRSASSERFANASGPGLAPDTESVVGYGSGRAWHGWTEPTDGIATDASSGGRDRGVQKSLGETLGRTAATGSAGRPREWGVFGPAIERWQQTLRRVAPSPTEATGKGGAQRLSAAFVEWMMGLDQGWVTDASIGLTRTEQLKALGNGVVPQQAVLALTILKGRISKEAA